jgi:itaconate CoA-transferase
VGLAHPSICPYGAFALADGALVLISIQNEREWRNFCAGVMGDAALPEKPGFESNVIRVRNRPVVDAAVAAKFAALSREAARSALDAAGTAYGFVNDVAGLAAHPALRRASIEAAGGSVTHAAPPALLDGAARPLRAVPRLGEHTAAIRAEFAG